MSSVFSSIHCCIVLADLPPKLEILISHKPDLRLGRSTLAPKAGWLAKARTIKQAKYLTVISEAAIRPLVILCKWLVAISRRADRTRTPHRSSFGGRRWPRWLAWAES